MPRAYPFLSQDSKFLYIHSWQTSRRILSNICLIIIICEKTGFVKRVCNPTNMVGSHSRNDEDVLDLCAERVRDLQRNVDARGSDSFLDFGNRASWNAGVFSKLGLCPSEPLPVFLDFVLQILPPFYIGNKFPDVENCRNA